MTFNLRIVTVSHFFSEQLSLWSAHRTSALNEKRRWGGNSWYCRCWEVVLITNHCLHINSWLSANVWLWEIMRSNETVLQSKSWDALRVSSNTSESIKGLNWEETRWQLAVEETFVGKDRQRWPIWAVHDVQVIGSNFLGNQCFGSPMEHHRYSTRYPEWWFKRQGISDSGAIWMILVHFGHSMHLCSHFGCLPAASSNSTAFSHALAISKLLAHWPQHSFKWYSPEN